MKKNLLNIVLAVLAVAAIVFCVVTGGQKNDLQKSVDDMAAQIKSMETETAKLTEEVAAAQEAAAEAARKAAEEEAARKAAEEEAARKAAEEAARKAAEEEAARKAAEEEAARKAAEEEAARIAAEKAARQGVIMDASVSVDGDLTPLLAGGAADEAQLAKISNLIDQVKKVLQAASLRVSVGQTSGQIAQLINGDPLATVSLRANEAGDGVEIISDLFPATMLTVSKDELTELLSAYTQQAGGLSIADLQNVDMQAIAETVTAAFTEMMQTIQASVGTPETGSFVINDVEYTTKVPFNITTKEMEILMLTTLKKIISDEQISGLLAGKVEGFSAEELDKTLEQLNGTDDAEFPPLDAAVYTNEAGDTCFTAALGEGDAAAMKCVYTAAGNRVTLNLDAGTVKVDIAADMEAQKISFSFDLGGAGSLKGSVSAVSADTYALEASGSFAQYSLSMNLTVTKGENRFDLTGTVIFNMLPISVNASVTHMEDRGDFVAALSIPTSMENPFTLTVKGSVAPGEVPAFEAGENLKVVTLTDLQKDEAAVSALNEEITGSAQTVAMKFMGMFPDLMSAYQDYQVMMNPMEEAAPEVDEEPVPTGETPDA